MRTTLVLCLLFTGGCKSLPHITLGKASVTGVADAGKPATLTQGKTKTSFVVPAGTQMQQVKVEATPTTPAKETITWNFTAPTKFETDASTLKADTGTVDTSVAQHKVDVASRQPLLYFAGVCLLACLTMMYFDHPTAAMMCGAASGIVFAAWRMPDLPEWFWMVGVACVVGGLCLAFGHAKATKQLTAK